jgi:NAD(P)-dependent dehydrogenase (short-subunit alcohol dehydrogenase family)
VTAPLAGQAAIVTGASAGLGEIMAGGLARAGCAVLLAARRADELARVAVTIEAGGGRALAHPADLRDPGHAQDLVDAALGAFGRLDGVVLNAAAAAVAPAEAEDPAAFDDVMRVNVGAQAALAAAAARSMIGASAGGWMILMSSILGRKAGTGPGVAAYVASKIAVEGLTRELARQWAPHGIRVNALAPGYFPTEMNAPMTADPGRRQALLARTPMGRPGAPADLVGPAVFLASDAARFVTGHTLPVDGGMSCW